MIVVIDSVITPYAIARYNTFQKVLRKTPLLVYFQTRKESLRDWTRFPTASFTYQQLNPIELSLPFVQLPPVRLNFSIIKKLSAQKNQIQRIIINGWDQPIYVQILLWANANRVPVTLRAGSTLAEQTVIRQLTLPYVKWFLSRCDDFLSYGSASSEYLRSLGADPTNIHPLYNTVDIQLFHTQRKRLLKNRKQLRRKLGIYEADTVFITNGRLISVKNFDLLIKAFAEVQKRFQSTKLIIIGEGPERQKLQSLSHQLAVNEQIIFPGFVQQDLLPKYYTSSDVFILPSKSEVWGLVINEAMASHLPILVSELVGSAKDLLLESKNGYILKPIQESIEKIMKKILRLSVQQRKKMGEKSWQHIQKFNNQKDYQHLVNIWNI